MMHGGLSNKSVDLPAICVIFCAPFQVMFWVVLLKTVSSACAENMHGNETIQSHLDFAALHLDVASRQIELQLKVVVHASMTHTLNCNSARL